MEGVLDPSNLIGRDIRPLQFASGPGFRHVDFSSRGSCSFRRLGYNQNAETFYKSVYTLSLAKQGRADRIQEEMSLICESELTFLLPKFAYFWGAILFDIFYPLEAGPALSRLLDMRIANGECEYITIVFDVQPTRPLRGKVNQNKRLVGKTKQASSYAEMYHAVLIARGHRICPYCGAYVLWKCSSG